MLHMPPIKGPTILSTSVLCIIYISSFWSTVVPFTRYKNRKTLIEEKRKGMSLEVAVLHRSYHNHTTILSIPTCNAFPISNIRTPIVLQRPQLSSKNILMISVPPLTSSSTSRMRLRVSATSLSGSLPPPLDLTEDNIRKVLVDARVELAQIFDTSVGMTG